MEELIEELENEIVPALKIVQQSLAQIDDSAGPRVLLGGIITRLQERIKMTAIN